MKTKFIRKMKLNVSVHIKFNLYLTKHEIKYNWLRKIVRKELRKDI